MKSLKARFDARITVEQKKLFEKAADYGGFRSMTDFVVTTAEQRAEAIIEEKETLIASDKDAEIFVNAILNPAAPNTALIDAAVAHSNFNKNETLSRKTQQET